MYFFCLDPKMSILSVGLISSGLDSWRQVYEEPTEQEVFCLGDTLSSKNRLALLNILMKKWHVIKFRRKSSHPEAF